LFGSCEGSGGGETPLSLGWCVSRLGWKACGVMRLEYQLKNFFIGRDVEEAMGLRFATAEYRLGFTSRCWRRAVCEIETVAGGIVGSARVAFVPS
jgi:hypothetical protein